MNVCVSLDSYSESHRKTQDDGSHTTIIADAKKQLIDAPLIVGDKSKLGPILYNGGSIVAGKGNRLRIDLLKGSSTVYSNDGTKPIKEVRDSLFPRVDPLNSAEKHPRIIMSFFSTRTLLESLPFSSLLFKQETTLEWSSLLLFISSLMPTSMRSRRERDKRESNWLVSPLRI